MVGWQVLSGGRLRLDPGGIKVWEQNRPIIIFIVITIFVIIIIITTNLIKWWMLQKNSLPRGATTAAQQQGGVEVGHVVATLRICNWSQN